MVYVSKVGLLLLLLASGCKSGSSVILEPGKKCDPKSSKSCSGETPKSSTKKESDGSFGSVKQDSPKEVVSGTAGSTGTTTVDNEKKPPASTPNNNNSSKTGSDTKIPEQDVSSGGGNSDNAEADLEEKEEGKTPPAEKQGNETTPPENTILNGQNAVSEPSAADITALQADVKKELGMYASPSTVKEYWAKNNGDYAKTKAALLAAFKEAVSNFSNDSTASETLAPAPTTPSEDSRAPNNPSKAPVNQSTQPGQSDDSIKDPNTGIFNDDDWI